MAASLFAWLFNFVELTCLPAALKALILHSFFLFSYVNALNPASFFCAGDGRGTLGAPFEKRRPQAPAKTFGQKRKTRCGENRQSMIFAAPCSVFAPKVFEGGLGVPFFRKAPPAFPQRIPLLKQRCGALHAVGDRHAEGAADFAAAGHFSVIMKTLLPIMDKSDARLHKQSAAE